MGILPMFPVMGPGTGGRVGAMSGRAHPNLELLLEPTLSICCFRYVADGVSDLDQLNQTLHRRLTHENRNMPSTTRVSGRLVLRPCFIGARTTMSDAHALVDDVLRIGAELASRSGTGGQRGVPSFQEAARIN
jgi:aromatic-L-amino-acid decarboxylase